MGKKENFVIKTDPQQIDGVVIHTEIENKESLENSEAVNELIKFCINTHHPLTFADFGNKFDSNEEIKLNEKTLEGLDELTIQDVKNFIKVFKLFISKPVFTDSFGKNDRNKKDPTAPTRNKWEEDNLDKMSKEARDFYYSNSLSVGYINPLIGLLDILEQEIKNPEIKKEITRLIKEFPLELEKRNENKIVIYNVSSNDKKVEVIKKVKEIAKQVVSLLEEKN